MRRTAMATACLALAACHSPAKEEEEPIATAAPPTAPVAPPVDHLADGELIEGPARAFDLALPRDLRVDGAFAHEIIASGPVMLHPVVQFFRTRLAGGDLREGERAATFEHAQVVNGPDRKLEIHIATVAPGVRVEVRDEAPLPMPKLSDDAARWKHAGLTPDGHLIDPTHLE